MNESTVVSPTSQFIPVDKIKPAAHQARKTFDEDAIKALAESIKEEGLLQPILVRAVTEGYELVSGERRLRATKLLASATIEAKVIQPVSEAEVAAKGLVENLQREDLNPIEEAEGFQTLNQLDSGYWTQDRIGKVAGKGHNYVSQALGLLKLPQSVQDYSRRRELSRSNALELLSLTPDKQQEAADQVVKQGLNLKQTRQLVAKMQGRKGPKAAKEPAAPAPVFNGGGQSFTFAQKGKHFTMVTDPPSQDLLDVYVQNFRCALIDYLNAPKPQAAPDQPPTDAAIIEKTVEPVKEAAAVA